MLEKFINSLDKAGFKLDDREIADILWLAIQMKALDINQNIEEIESEPDVVNQKPNFSPPESKILAESNGTSAKKTERRVTNNVANIYLQPSSRSNTLSSRPINYTPLKVPTATALPHALSIARALRPLMRKVPSLKEKIIDEPATVNRIAEENIWLPVLKSVPTRWLELALVVEENSFVSIWKQTISELHQLLQCHGAFQDVRTWRLKADSQEIFPKLKSISKPKARSYKELNDPTGRRLIVVVSDCTSPAWYDGTIYQLFREWSKYSPVTILQLLPEKLWTRTALGMGTPIMLNSRAPGVPNRKLLVAGLDPWEAGEIDFTSALKMPVITLEAKPIADWSKVVAGSGSTTTAGYIIESFDDWEREEVESLPKLSASEKVSLFHATASQTARRLAGLIAAVPVSLPIIRLIQKTMLPDSQQVHVAEVFMSGLLTKLSTEFSNINPDYIEYEFAPEIRELLLQSIPKRDSVNVIQYISQYLAERMGLSIGEFRAVLFNPQSEKDETAKNNLLPFAQIAARVLRRLGGEYTAIAEQLEENWGNNSTLELISEPLPKLEYKTVTIDNLGELTNIEAHQTTYYEELLGYDIPSIIMIRIPKGGFMMGSLKSEESSEERERTQHTVKVSQFFMGRYPVTQDQWRVVATNLPPILQKLNPNPSRFKGKNYPVERVTWYDAIEFCARLSIYTKKNYRLPSEAEWEYACRAGTTTPFNFGETISTQLANYNGNYAYAKGKKGDYRQRTTPVDFFKIANAFGLSDMHGNVWEWCADPWHQNYQGAPKDRGVWDEKNNNNKYDRNSPEHLAELFTDKRPRIIRGGSWGDNPKYCRSAYRSRGMPGDRLYSRGFRIACNDLGSK